MTELSSSCQAARRAYAVLAPVSRGYPPLTRQVAYVLRTRPPLMPRRTPVRLACVKRAASVRPEPGSNSPIVESKRSGERNAWFRSELSPLMNLSRSDAEAPRAARKKVRSRASSIQIPRPRLSNSTAKNYLGRELSKLAKPGPSVNPGAARKPGGM